MIEGIDNIGLAVSDRERAIAFYLRLGFAELYRNERGVTLAAGSAKLFVFESRKKDVPAVARGPDIFMNPPGIDQTASWSATSTPCMPSCRRRASRSSARPRIRIGARAPRGAPRS